MIFVLVWSYGRYVDSYHFHLENDGWEDITGGNEVGIMKWR